MVRHIRIACDHGSAQCSQRHGVRVSVQFAEPQLFHSRVAGLVAREACSDHFTGSVLPGLRTLCKLRRESWRIVPISCSWRACPELSLQRDVVAIVVDLSTWLVTRMRDGARTCSLVKQCRGLSSRVPSWISRIASFEAERIVATFNEDRAMKMHLLRALSSHRRWTIVSARRIGRLSK